MKIEVYGSGCAKCKKTFENVKEAVKQAGVNAEVVSVFDAAAVIKKGISKTPAVLIDNKIKIGGRVPEVEEIKKIITE
jgi:small redox-active disulfide protein 2